MTIYLVRWGMEWAAFPTIALRARYVKLMGLTTYTFESADVYQTAKTGCA
jgi:hypothetical protein